MAIGDTKTFDIVYQGLNLQIVAVDNADGTVDFTVTSLVGSADINALYWNDGDAIGGEGTLIGFTGAISENSLNMNGSNVLWDDIGTSTSATPEKAAPLPRKVNALLLRISLVWAGRS